MMRHRWLPLASMCIAAFALPMVPTGVPGVPGVTAPAQDATNTVWDGVYTEGQASRGQESYKKTCGHCHRDDLSGGGSEIGAPALRGPIFTIRWRDQPVSELFLTIGTTMPHNAPDTLTPQTVIDIVSFLLKANEMPVGKTELPPQLEKLRNILVTDRAIR
jgi:mono/diheme cytochrome c family protein